MIGIHRPIIYLVVMLVDNPSISHCIDRRELRIRKRVVRVGYSICSNKVTDMLVSIIQLVGIKHWVNSQLRDK